MIRSYIKNKIFNSLNYDVFRFEDFVINESNSSTSTTMRIIYNSFFYNIRFTQDAESCEIYYNPGFVLSEESDTITMKYIERSIEDSIHDWLRRTKKEMLNPVQERYINMEIQDFRKELDAKLNEIEDTFFTKEESEKLKERLDILEQMISDEKLKNADMQSEVNKMRSEIEFLRNTVDKMERKKWIKNAFLKIWAWGKDPENQKLIEAGVNTIKTISNMDLSNLSQ